MDPTIQNEGGFGLVELVIAMTVMTVGIMGIVAGFSSGITALQLGAKASVAGALADQTMEAYRRGTFASIPVGLQAPAAPVPAAPDGRVYSIVTTVSWTCVAGPANTTTTPTPPPTCTGPAASRPVKLVSIDVHDLTPTGRIVARQNSTFDASTG